MSPEYVRIRFMELFDTNGETADEFLHDLIYHVGVTDYLSESAFLFYCIKWQRNSFNKKIEKLQQKIDNLENKWKLKDARY